MTIKDSVLSYEEFMAAARERMAYQSIWLLVKEGLKPFRPGEMTLFYDHWLAHYPNQIVLHLHFRDHPYLNATFRVDPNQVDSYGQDFVLQSGLGPEIVNYYRYCRFDSIDNNIELGEN